MNIYIEHSKYKNVRKVNTFFRILLTSFLIISVSTLVACTSLVINTNLVSSVAKQFSNRVDAGGVTVTSVTFIAEVDAYVNESNPSTNYGNSTTLQVNGASNPQVESFIRFTVTGISGSIQAVQLRVNDTTNGSTNGPAVYSTGTSWTETGITWNNRPVRTSGALDNKGSISTNTWAEYDVTSSVTENGTFSFVLAADSSDGATFSSRQGAQPPQLVLTLTDGSTSTSTPTATNTFTQSAPSTATQTAISTATNTQAPITAITFVTNSDAYVNQANPSTNYGNATTLQVDGASDPDIESFIRFTVTGISTALRISAIHSATRSGSAIKHAPILLFCTRSLGQPTFRLTSS